MSNTIWRPKMQRQSGVPLYRSIADALSHDIERGVLTAGSRLPTHRDLAKRLGITTLTVSRAYAEAARHGLIDAEVGRGTFVRTARTLGSGGMADLSRNVIAANEDIDLAPAARAAVERLLRMNQYGTAAGSARHRAAGAAWIARSGAGVAAESVLVTPGAQFSIYTILGALLAPGDTLLCDALTYPGFRAAVGGLRLSLEPLPLDDDGIQPRALEKACTATGAKVLYTVPTFQNPTGTVMSDERRRAIAAIAKRHGLTIIEDDAYNFLLEPQPAPLASLLPDQVCYVASTSKSVSPSLRVGFIAAPEALLPRIENAIAATISFASTVAAEIFTILFESGEVDRVVARKRELIGRAQRTARRHFGDALGATHAQSPHAWLQLGEGWSGQELARRAHDRGVAVAPSALFAVAGRSFPEAVRISVGALGTAADLDDALRVIAALLAAPAVQASTIV